MIRCAKKLKRLEPSADRRLDPLGFLRCSPLAVLVLVLSKTQQLTLAFQPQQRQKQMPLLYFHKLTRPPRKDQSACNAYRGRSLLLYYLIAGLAHSSFHV
jgi:hypothetical protein